MAGKLIAKHDIPKTWWKEAVVYQVYPSSFCDSNNDGIGDLQGVISKVDYLKRLGVDVVWLSPIFKSPQNDMGYDISDYEDVHAPYGTVQDVERLIKELHQRGMKLVLDLVVNHSSDQHPWFIESRSSKSSPKRDWYIWRPARYDSEGKRHPPCNWKAAFEGSVWTWDEKTEEYYLHYYDYSQPDLNYENPAVREAVYSLMRFWLDKGCDGYRMDVIGRISKASQAELRNLDFPDVPVKDPKQEWQEWPQGADEFRPRIHEFVQEMNRKVISKYDMMSVGEFNHTTVPQMLQFVLPERHEIQMGFTFEHVNLGLLPDNKLALGHWTLPELKRILANSQALRDMGAWHAPYLENHDQPRSVSRYASDSPEWRWASAKMLSLMHCTMFGTLFVYQGQEIGMINLPTDWPLSEWKDIRLQNYVKQMVALGESADVALRTVQSKARDNARSPMQWANERHGGFSTSQPWMRVSEDYEVCNVAQQDGKDGSVLEFWKDMLRLRKEVADVFVYGSFELLSPDHTEIFAYIRAEAILVVLNFSDKPVKYECPRNLKDARLIKATTPGTPETLGDSTVSMKPWSGVVYHI